MRDSGCALLNRVPGRRPVHRLFCLLRRQARSIPLERFACKQTELPVRTSLRRALLFRLISGGWVSYEMESGIADLSGNAEVGFDWVSEEAGEAYERLRQMAEEEWRWLRERAPYMSAREISQATRGVRLNLEPIYRQMAELQLHFTRPWIRTLSGWPQAGQSSGR